MMGFVGVSWHVGKNSSTSCCRADRRASGRVMMSKRKKELDDKIGKVSYTEIPTEADFGDWTPVPLEDDEFTKVVRTAAAAADERKGRNIVALRVARLTHITTFFVYISAGSAPQIRAIANLVEDKLEEEHDLKPLYGKPGNPSSGWLLLDYGDFMVNVFSEEARKYYNPEEFWKHGEKLDLTDVVSPTGLRTPEDNMLSLDDEEDALNDDWSLD